MRLLTTMVALVLFAACSATDPREGTSAKGVYTVSYQPTPDPIPMNELFALDFAVRAAGKAAPDDTTFALKATMPEHGHGMQTEPVVTKKGAGLFHVEGMKFHMMGRWQLDLTLGGSAGADTATLLVDL
jgi:hypothetical protein